MQVDRRLVFYKDIYPRGAPASRKENRIEGIAQWLIEWLCGLMDALFGKYDSVGGPLEYSRLGVYRASLSWIASINHSNLFSSAFRFQL